MILYPEALSAKKRSNSSTMDCVCQFKCWASMREYNGVRLTCSISLNIFFALPGLNLMTTGDIWAVSRIDSWRVSTLFPREGGETVVRDVDAFNSSV